MTFQTKLLWLRKSCVFYNERNTKVMKNVKYVSMTESLTLYLYSFGASWTDINCIFSKLKFGSIFRTMKVCYLVILLLLITVVNRAGAGYYESNSSVSNFANVSGPRVRYSKNHNVWKLLKMSHLEFSTNFYVLIKVTCLVTLFDLKFQVSKTRQNWPFLAFLMNFCPLKMKT